MAAPPKVGETEADRNARNLLYVAVLLKEAGIDPKKAGPDLVFQMARPYEARGISADDIRAMIAECDPPTPPPWDPVTCFEASLRARMKPKAGLGVGLAIVGIVAFAGAFVLTKRLK